MAGGRKIVCGLGNPGGEYARTRHNVGWWVLDATQKAWKFSPWRRDGRARVTSGLLGDRPVGLIKPITYMNRSGAALAGLRDEEGFDVSHDLLVVVDDTALDVGRVRFRSEGSAGGHNGLKSVEAVLRTRDYPRLRIGVGTVPPGEEMADWVLEPFSREDESIVRELLPTLVDAVRVWVEEGVSSAANRYNR
ncbi:MAG: aminoacyl-tRNA hydrolase [Longimicrobiales bacterium]